MDRNLAAGDEGVPIRWRLPDAGRVRIAAFNSAGEFVATVYDAENEPGRSGATRWDARNHRGERVSSNVYVLRVVAPGHTRSYKVAVTR